MKNAEMAQWLKGLPLAPEFRPTDTEFADPIAYISKIEKEASAFGICKVIPPFPKPSRKYVLHNLNKSLAKCPELGSDVKIGSLSKTNGGDCRAVFTTRRQELGRNEKKKMKGVAASQPVGAQKQVWQSGEVYTLEQFEAKSKAFARNQYGLVKDASPLVTEAMFWSAVSQEPVYVEYANDVPGSAFGEPEGVFNIYRKKRRRRKRAVFDRNNKSTCDSKNEVDIVNNDNIDKESCSSYPSSCTESASACLTSSKPGQVTSAPGPLCSSDSNDVEGTAGWKLTNSAWNLQVIARSPGSLTRYMPDDIPGVTSPMVYIGMMFSWFAWHVEDHELHSLNFLHMGSPKTWYAVPGDYALQFEEAIRVHAYGGNTDQLASLTLLGEKTTLMSPEVVVSSGIPCCRLVQYPGEFVVTFPRAYHVGFSHGFNCGEAANFGTPQWLTVAKDAAVRRAAMDFLPMLSHQQLLYLLTMSFVLRVPKSLLPGVRSSRLRDRQREERETLVKKAFVADVLKENELVTILLQKHSSYRAVIWDVNMLPSSSKEIDLQKRVGTEVEITKGNAQTENYINPDILSQMNSYMDSLSDFCVDDDDLSNDFHIDSGALPCIACGILGFPFMAVVQPSEKAAKNISLKDCHTMHKIGEPKALESRSSSKQDGIEEGNVAVDTSKPHERLCRSQEASSSADSRHSSISQMKDHDEKLDVDKKFRRPQIFCLEHAIQTEELLRSRGGANVLVICHSDFKKIKAYASVIAKEMNTVFAYNEIDLDSASEEDLRLIDFAIEDGNSECGEDWTSKLCINLLHSVKLSRNNRAKKLQYALILSRLFSGKAFSTKSLNFNWESRKVRSKRKLNCQAESKPTVSLKTEEKGLGPKLDIETARERNTTIQYRRKRYKSKPCASADVSKVFLDSNTLVPHEKERCKSESALIRNEGAEAGSSYLRSCSLASKGEQELLLECQTQTLEDQNENSHAKDSPVVTSQVVENPSGQSKDCNSSKELSVDIERVNLESSACSVVTEKSVDLPGTYTKSPESCSNGPSERKSTEQTDKDQERTVSNEASDLTEYHDKMGHETLSENENNQEKAVSNIATESVNIQVQEPDPMLSNNSKENHSLQSVKDSVDANRTMGGSRSTTNDGGERRGEKGECNISGFIKSPCEGLRPRARKDTSGCTVDCKKPIEENPSARKSRNCSEKSSNDKKKEQRRGSHRCDFEGCKMSFQTKSELSLHRRNRCPVDGCGKKFNSHKYAILHQRVHEDDRPLKCPWKGCSMSFKWAWARTEHLRVHTGERPYKCSIEGCGLTFRFVSDFSRHRRKTGHHSR